MPVKTGVIEHGKPGAIDFPGQHHGEAYGKKHHADNDMQAMQAGDHIVKSEKYIQTRFTVHQGFRIGVDAVMDLGTPLEILVHKKNEPAKN